MKSVVVINQFAVPRTVSGGTRHIDLFSRVPAWSPVIVAGNRVHSTQRRFTTSDSRFRLLTVPRQGRGVFGRTFGWLIFGIQAFAVTSLQPRLDLVYGSSPQPLSALAGLWAARIRRKPFVLEVRDLWPESIVAFGRLRKQSLAYRLLRALEGHLVSGATHIVCVTEGWEGHFAELNAHSERITVIPNGTEPADFEVTTDRNVLRDRYGISGFTAIFAGAHGLVNGLDLILDAAVALPNVNFLLIGDGLAKQAAIARVASDGITNVEFRDPVTKEDLPGLLRACDVGIHSLTPLPVFDKGASPNKLFDYMAAGLPVVSNMAAGLSRIIQDGECGRIGGPWSLTDNIRAVYEASPEQRALWGKRAVELVNARYSRQAAALKLSSVLENSSSRSRK